MFLGGMKRNFNEKQWLSIKLCTTSHVNIYDNEFDSDIEFYFDIEFDSDNFEI